MYSLRIPIWKHLLSRQRLQKRRLHTSMRHLSSYGHLKCSCTCTNNNNIIFPITLRYQFWRIYPISLLTWSTLSIGASTARFTKWQRPCRGNRVYVEAREMLYIQPHVFQSTVYFRDIFSALAFLSDPAERRICWFTRLLSVRVQPTCLLSSPTAWWRITQSYSPVGEGLIWIWMAPDDTSSLDLRSCTRFVEWNVLTFNDRLSDHFSL